MMETAGMKAVLEQLRPHISDKQVSLTHDNDSKTSKLLADSGLKITDLLDPGHSVQSIERTAKTFFERCAETLYNEANKDVLASQEGDHNIPKLRKRGKVKGAISKASFMKPYEPLIPKLKIWFNYLVNNVSDIDLRQKMWMNTANHFVGIHSDCIHPEELKSKGPGRPRTKPAKTEFWEWTEGKNNEVLISQLIYFLNQTTERLCHISDTSTQSNESLNANIAKYCPKNRTFSASVEARVSVAVAKKNDPHFETKFLTKHFSSQVCNKSIMKLFKMEEELISAACSKGDRREMLKRNMIRQELRKTNQHIVGDYKKDMIF